MEVTRHNFARLLPEIEAAIGAADFMSVDGEFTGLLSGGDVNSFDTPTECYQFYRRSSKEFLLVQLGLSLFRYDAASGRYGQSTYAFYLFPRPEVRGAADKVFSCQSSSMDFLAKHKFDFNKVFYDGISYIDTAEEVKLREYIEEKQKMEKAAKPSSRESLGNTVTVPPNFQPQIDQMCEQVNNMLKDPQKESVEFENLNAFQRKLGYQELESKFKKDIFIETKMVEDKRILVVSRGITEQERIAKMELAHEKDWAEVDAAVGFSMVAKLISDSRKLIVGHNIILDLMHVMDSFFYPLPDVYSAFKQLVPHIFPNIIDTMYIVKSSPFKDIFTTVDLKSLYKALQTDPFHMPNIEPISKDENDSDENNRFHNAGYDAYITGSCFIALFEHLKKTTSLGNMECSLNAEADLLKPYLNRLFLFKTHFQGSPCINLAGNDPNPHREHVFHLTFPKEWRRNDITDLFEPYGGATTVAFIDDTTAYVSLKQHNKSEVVRRDLCKSKENYVLVPYWEYKINAKKKLDEDRKSSVDVALESSPISDALTPIMEKSDEKPAKRKCEKLSGNPDIDLAEAADKARDVAKLKAKAASKQGKKRKLSHTSSGDFLVSGKVSKEDKRISGDTSKVFEESNVWE